jgi:hypothetical protein
VIGGLITNKLWQHSKEQSDYIKELTKESLTTTKDMTTALENNTRVIEENISLSRQIYEVLKK